MAESFLSSLLSKASSLSEQKLLKGTQVQTTARVYKATDKPLSEPKYVPKSTSGIDSLLQQAKDYGTNKPQQVNPAAGYLTSLYSGNLNTVQQAKTGVFNAAMDNYNKSLARWNAAPASTIGQYGGRVPKAPFAMVKPTENDPWYSNPTPINPPNGWKFTTESSLRDLQNSYVNSKVYRDMLSEQSTQLQGLNKTQESLFGVGFSGVDAQTLQSANWTGVKGLQAEVEKYKSLRDIYATKYAKDQSETNLSYLKSYNTLVYDTSKNMVDETSRTLIAAKKNAVIGDQTKQSTVSALEKYSEVLGGTTTKDIKQPTDVNTDVSRMKQQILARTNEVSGYLEKVKSSPKFEERPL